MSGAAFPQDPFDSQNVSDDASTDAPGDELPPVLALASTTGIEEEVDFHAKAVEEKEGDARRTFAAWAGANLLHVLKPRQRVKCG